MLLLLAVPVTAMAANLMRIGLSAWAVAAATSGGRGASSRLLGLGTVAAASAGSCGLASSWAVHGAAGLAAYGRRVGRAAAARPAASPWGLGRLSRWCAADLVPGYADALRTITGSTAGPSRLRWPGGVDRYGRKLSGRAAGDDLDLTPNRNRYSKPNDRLVDFLLGPVPE